MSKTFTLSTEYDWKDARFDLDSLFRFATEAPFELPAEVTLHACVMGENDESHWYWIFEHEKQVYYATGWCDYTGWDCQSGGIVEAVDSVEVALSVAPEKDDVYAGGRPIREYLQKMVNEDWQIGVIG